MLNDPDIQKVNGLSRSPPQGNTNPQFTSVLPPTSQFAVKGDFEQLDVTRAFRDLDPPTDISKSLVQGFAEAVGLILKEIPKPERAKDLALSGEVALFKEIMSDW